MFIERDFFKNFIDDVKDELCCYIPINFKGEKVIGISEQAFYDWKKLEYVFIPDSINTVRYDAFLWDNIKVIFADLDKTRIYDLPSDVKVIPTRGISSSIFELFKETIEIKKQIEFDPDKIEKIDKKLTKLVENFTEGIEEKETFIRQTNESIKESLGLLNTYSQECETVANEVIDKLSDLIEDSLNKEVEIKKEEIEEAYGTIVDKIEELNEIVKKSTNTKNKLEDLSDKVDEYLNNKLKEIKQTLQNEANNLKNQYEENKTKVMDQIIEDATQVLIKKNPCKQVIVNIEESKKKFETKDIFHKDFEKILRLVSTRKPILLKGPAGSGKNVIIEQVAKSLGLDLYYSNDVTDEYKIMGFVDANGKYVETQFFKSFTKGGLMFVDEIDNSNLSALLAMNAAIGTGYNHYMAFPDGNFYQAHPDFHLVAAANTFGTGADMIYCGRQQLDGATLNRFTPVVIDYDTEIERRIVNHEEILELYWSIRNIIQANTIKHVISTRNIKNASDYMDMNCFSMEDIFDWTIIQGLDKTDLNIIYARLDINNPLANQFKEHLIKKYKLDKKL